MSEQDGSLRALLDDLVQMEVSAWLLAHRVDTALTETHPPSRLRALLEQSDALIDETLDLHVRIRASCDEAAQMVRRAREQSRRRLAGRPTGARTRKGQARSRGTDAAG